MHVPPRCGVSNISAVSFPHFNQLSEDFSPCDSDSIKWPQAKYLCALFLALMAFMTSHPHVSEFVSSSTPVSAPKPRKCRTTGCNQYDQPWHHLRFLDSVWIAEKKSNLYATVLTRKWALYLLITRDGWLSSRSFPEKVPVSQVLRMNLWLR